MTIRDYLNVIRRARAGETPQGGFPPNPTAPATIPPIPQTVTRTVDGHVDVMAGGRYSLRVAGWARDTDTPGDVSVRVEVAVIDSAKPLARFDLTATNPRPDVPGHPARGFDTTLPLLAGDVGVCVTALNSVGTPGDDVVLECRRVTILSDAPADPLPPAASWLQTINQARAGSGLEPMVDEPAWTDPIVKHLVYLRDTPAEFFTGEYVNRHRENPASPYYTPEGANSHNVLSEGAVRTERRVMEGWLAAPFHALLGLTPTSNRAAFAMLDGKAAAKFGAAVPIPVQPTVPVITPGNGAVTSLTSFRGESPDPRDPCPEPELWRGLPLIVQLPYAPPAGITARMVLPHGIAVAESDLCVVSEQNYVPRDPIYGAAGKAILDSADAVLIIPRDPLTPGTHQVTLDVPGHPPIQWSFAVSRGPA